MDDDEKTPGGSKKPYYSMNIGSPGIIFRKKKELDCGYDKKKKKGLSLQMMPMIQKGNSDQKAARRT